MIKHVLAATLVASLTATAGAAPLLLEGKTVGYNYLFPDASTVYEPTQPNAVVGAGFEWYLIPGELPLSTVDLSNGFLQINLLDLGVPFSPGAFNGVRIFDALGILDDITNVEVDAATTPQYTVNTAESTAFRFSYDANNVYINLENLDIGAGGIIRLSLSSGDSVPVPEPGTFALAGLAVLGVIGTRRRNRA